MGEYQRLARLQCETARIIGERRRQQAFNRSPLGLAITASFDALKVAMGEAIRVLVDKYHPRPRFM